MPSPRRRAASDLTHFLCASLSNEYDTKAEVIFLILPR